MKKLGLRPYFLFFMCAPPDAIAFYARKACAQERMGSDNAAGQLCNACLYGKHA